MQDMRVYLNFFSYIYHFPYQCPFLGVYICICSCKCEADYLPQWTRAFWCFPLFINTEMNMKVVISGVVLMADARNVCVASVPSKW